MLAIVDDNTKVTVLYHNTHVDPLIQIDSEVLSKSIHAQSQQRKYSMVVPVKNHYFLRIEYKIEVAYKKLKFFLWVSSSSLIHQKEWPVLGHVF